MTNPEPDNRPPSRPHRRLWLMLLGRVGVPLIAIGAVAIAGGIWYGWKFVNEELAPLVQTNLSQLLDRPVQLGRVESFSLNRLRFGKSSIPATPTDRDRASVEAVEVAFDPIQLLLTRRLKLDITLVQPDIFLDQTKDGVWVATTLKAQEESGPIKTDLDVLRFRNANVELLAFPKTGQKAVPVTLKGVTGAANFFDRNRRIAYELDGESTKGGKIDVKGETIVDNGLNSNLDVRGQNFLVAEIDRLVKLPINLNQGRTNGSVNVQLRPNQRAIVKGTADFNDVTLQIPQLPQQFAKGTGKLQIDDTLITLEQTSAQLGKIPLTANGKIDTEKGFDLSAKVKAVTVANFFNTFAVKLPFATAGEATADVKVTGAVNRPILTGRVRNTKLVKVDRLDINRASADFRLDTGTLNLALSDVQATPSVGGQITGDGQLQLNEPRSIVFDFRAQNLPGDAIAKLYNNGNAPPITVGSVNTQGQVVGRLDNVQTIARWQAPEASYPATGEVVVAGGNTILRNTVVRVAGGTVTAQGRTLNGRWQGTVQAAGIRANQFAPQVQGLVSGNFQLAGSLSSFSPVSIQATGQAKLANGSNVINANISANAGQWQADTQIAALPLAQFSSQLRGNLSGNVRLAGNLNQLNASNIRADGRVRLSQGISLIEQPIVAQVNWDGRRLNIPQATAPGFSANGSLLARLDGTPQITGLDLNIRTNGYSLATLPPPRPPVTQLSGVVDLVGRITGTPENPNVAGNLAVRGLALNGIQFEPVLRGNLSLSPTRGFALNVAGGSDRIALDLNPQFRPRSFRVDKGDAVVAGIASGNLLRVNVSQLPIDGFTLPGVNLARFGGLAGNLRGDLNIDLNQLRVIDGRLAIDQFRLGTFRSETATTEFVNNNNVFRFSEIALTNGTTRYAVSGNLDLRSAPRFDGKLNVAQGKIEEVLAGLQYFNLQDFTRGTKPPTYDRADALQTTEVGDPNAPLLEQLRRFSEINALIQQTAEARRKTRTPELADVRGTFNGDVNFSASLATGIEADFDLSAQNVQWYPYRAITEVVNGQVEQQNDRVLTADRVRALGRLDNGVVTLEPLRLESGDAQINLIGQFGGTTQSGQLQVRNIPIEEINRFYPLPLGVEGKLNANVTVSGTRENPAAVGQVQVADASLNNTPVESATGNFTYVNSRVSFDSRVAISGPEPISIQGSIPYQLLPDSVRPDNPNIQLKVNVKNEGLAVLNLFTPQLAWRGGQGEVNLDVGGTLLRPSVLGNITLNNATIEATALQEPLTGVTGTINFNRDRVSVQQLQGQFNRGQVIASGVLPILPLGESDPDLATPLTVQLDRLTINRKGLYEGAVNGRIDVRGTAFAPQIGGQVQLTDGQILLPDNTTTATAGNPGGGRAQSQAATLTLNNLQLVLGDRVRITRAPIISFVATGGLTVNGPIDALRPEGTIRLTSGQVNLFTTQFVLARGYPQTAVFERDRGLDPVLDIRLIALVPEVTRSRVAAPNTAEFEDDSLFATSLGALQTVRIQARATGPSSQLFNNLELTSSPTRSRNEIIALIGGGFVNTLGRGDSTLGIANLAGSALLSNIQGFIGNALGVSDFRLFPTLLRNDERRSATLGLAAELGVDITRNLSASVLRVLTADQPTQFGVRYRINDSLLFRGSSDFSGDTRAVLEYETRF